MYSMTSNIGLSIGSSVSGGVEDVLYFNNTMTETREQWGQGVHIKTRIGIGGYIRNIVWDSNLYHSTGTEGVCCKLHAQGSAFEVKLLESRCIYDHILYLSLYSSHNH